MTTSFDDCSSASRLYTFDCSSGSNGFMLSQARCDIGSGGIVFDNNVPGDTPGVIPRGVMESSEVAVPAGFDQVVLSWNSYTPPASYLVLYVRVRVKGSWTGWYNMGVWNTSRCPEPRTSVKHQKDSFGHVDTDTLILSEPADAFKVRAELSSADSISYPVLRMVSVNVIKSTDPATPDSTRNDVWGKELDVPELCQLSVDGGEGWCSPTSTAMVLSYWGERLGRSDLSVGITETAKGVYDKAWRGTGNWVFNTAYAGEFKGIRAYVTRLRGVSEVEDWIAKGIPVIVSIDYNKLNRRDRTDRMGHLIVIRGFTQEGDLIINDPWAHLDKGQRVRKIFKRADLEYSWLGSNGSYGTAYLIYPEDMGF